jgi:hypothetical protein
MGRIRLSDALVAVALVPRVRVAARQGVRILPGRVLVVGIADATRAGLAGVVALRLVAVAGLPVGAPAVLTGRARLVRAAAVAAAGDADGTEDRAAGEDCDGEEFDDSLHFLPPTIVELRIPSLDRGFCPGDGLRETHRSQREWERRHTCGVRSAQPGRDLRLSCDGG